MTKKAALVVTALLTVFVLVMMMGVMTRLTAVDASASPSSDAVAQAVPQSAQVAPIAQSDTAPVIDAQLAQQREQIYHQRLDEANAEIQKANAQIQKANEQLQQLQAQNTQMLQREQTYQQRLQEANSRLTQQGTQAVVASQTTQTSPQQATTQPQTTGPQQPGQILTSQQQESPRQAALQQTPQQSVSQQMLSPDQAVAIAAQYMDGRVMNVQLVNAAGSTAYNVKISSGDVGIDAYNGNVLFIREGRSLVRNPGGNESRRKSHEHDDD